MTGQQIRQEDIQDMDIIKPQKWLVGTKRQK